jgi:putative hydrolase of the HAD superfamily
LIKNLRCVFFDLDNTIYSNSSGLMQEIGKRINLYMLERLGMSVDEVTGTRDKFLRAFGTTLNALRRFYPVDPDEFLDFVHDIPLEDYLQYDPELDQMLQRIELKKVIFTNADAQHARRVLSRMGILRHFESIIDIHMLEFINKPDRRAYLRALDFVSARPDECILVEDSWKNIVAAKKLGIISVMVGNSARTNGADYHIHRITDLESVLV